MDRKTFFKEACKLGVCACTGIAMLSGKAQAQDSDAAGTEAPKEDWRIGFTQIRMAKLIDLVNDNVDEKTRDAMLEELGRTCSLQSLDSYKAFVGNIQGYLDQIEGEWAEKAKYDESTKTITIIGTKMERCFCPMVHSDKMSKSFCNCTLGWQKQTFEYILEQPVKATVTESILRGGDRCSFMIQAV